MKIGLNDRWFISTGDHHVRLQLGRVSLYLSKVALRPQGKGKRTLRIDLLNRDGWRCKECGKKLTYETTEIHHLKPKRTFPELAKDPANLVCLCHDCHTEIHRQQNKEVARQMKKIYQSIDTTVSVNPAAPTLAALNGLKAI